MGALEVVLSSCSVIENWCAGSLATSVRVAQMWLESPTPPGRQGKSALRPGGRSLTTDGPVCALRRITPLSEAAQHALTRGRGLHLLVLACAADSTRRPVGLARFACPPARGLCRSQERGVMRRRAHTGGASPPKLIDRGRSIFAGAKIQLWLPPCPSLAHLDGRALSGLRKIFQLSALHL
jgi:hypothetical protein